jgi:hypothetical protein
LSLAATGCGGSSQPIAYDDVSAQLRPAEFTRRVQQVFHTRSDLLDYLEHAMPGRRIHLPPIDFSSRDAILFAAGPRSSTGYAMRVLSLRETDDRLVLTVHERTPSLGERVTPKVTYPFLLLTVPRSDKRLLLKWPGRP